MQNQENQTQAAVNITENISKTENAVPTAQITPKPKIDQKIEVQKILQTEKISNNENYHTYNHTVDDHGERMLALLRTLKIVANKTRLLAFSNEVAESFRTPLPQLIKPLYMVSFAYIGFDIARTVAEVKSFGYEVMKYRFGDAFFFHLFASLLIPR